MSSPPTFSFFAWRLLRIPRDVVRTETPRPSRTLATPAEPRKIRRPGDETRLMSVRTRRFSASYFRNSHITLRWGSFSSVTTLTSARYPSDLRTCATPSFSFEWGTLAFRWRRWFAFLMIAIMSPTGSLLAIAFPHPPEPRAAGRRRTYHDAFRTPGISPLLAKSRKHNRHTPNFRW